MMHDRLCPSAYSTACECSLIEQVRRDDARIVRDYAEQRLVKTRHPNMSEDITAALRVAAMRIENVNVPVSER